MLNLSLTAVVRGPVQLRGQLPIDDPVWHDAGFVLGEPLQVELEARTVGEGVLVRGTMKTELAGECRRCLAPVPIPIQDRVDLLFEPLSAEEETELSGEVYPLPDRGDQLGLSEPLREQLVLRIPAYVVCSESCRGLCPHCGADLNRGECTCVSPAAPGPWDALKNVKFD